MASFEGTVGIRRDGEGPIDNRPSTNYRHQFVKRRRRKKERKKDIWPMTCNTWHMTHDTWHVTPDTWHVTGDIWEEGNLLSKFQLPSFYGLGARGDMGHLTYESAIGIRVQCVITMQCIMTLWYTALLDGCSVHYVLYSIPDKLLHCARIVLSF